MTAPAAASNDKVTLFGVLGIIGGICCVILGVIFSILSLQEAKKHGKPPTLAYVGFAVCAVNLVGSIILTSTGALSNMF